MLDAQAQHPNCGYMWMNWITNPDIQAQVAEWFGEAPANLKACDETTDPKMCDTYHAADAPYFDKIWFWSTPQTRLPRRAHRCRVCPVQRVDQSLE